MLPLAPTLADLELDEALLPLTREKSGLVLIAGCKASGRSTTLAALLNEINEREPVHIVTLERTVEFKHQPKKATFERWEMGKDFANFADGLKAASRRSPSVIMAAELADRESVEAALCAVKSGCRVFAAFTAVAAWHFVSRLLGLFGSKEQEWVRVRLAEELRWLVCQRLAPGVDGDRRALLEIMGNNSLTRSAITGGGEEMYFSTFDEVFSANYLAGWRTFDQSCIDAYAQGQITEETAMVCCSRRGPVSRGIEEIKRKRHRRWGLS